MNRIKQNRCAKQYSPWLQYAAELVYCVLRAAFYMLKNHVKKHDVEAVIFKSQTKDVMLWIVCRYQRPRM